MTFVPGEIEMLIHYYYSVEEHWSQLNGAAAGAEWMSRAIAEGLLTKLDASEVAVDAAIYPSHYGATDKLKRLVQAWCETPMPVQQWVIPEPGAQREGFLG